MQLQLKLEIVYILPIISAVTRPKKKKEIFKKSLDVSRWEKIRLKE